MRKSFILTFFLSLFFHLSSQDCDLYSLMRDRNEFYFEFKADLHKLTEISKIISIDKVSEDNVVAYANNDEYEKFLTLGIPTTLLVPPSMSESHKMYDGKNRDEYEWNEYPTYEMYETMLREYAESYSEKCSLVELGALESGRKLLIIRINDNVDAAKPKVLLTSTIHGDETTGYIMMLRLIDELLTKEGLPEVDRIRNNVDLFICPNANPDGTYRNGNNTVTGATRANAFGVDMNRNYPDCVDGMHPDDKGYALETELFMRLADEHQFTMSANYHGGAEVVNYPWDNNTTRHADELWWRTISRQYADLAHEKNPDYMTDRNNGVTNGADWYMINGSRQDYMNYYQQCREVTIECSSTKCPPASDLPLYWEYNRNSIFAFLGQVLLGIHGTVKDAETQMPLNATIRILNHDYDYSMVESQQPHGDFYRPINAGTYTVEISSEGYVSKQETVVVRDGEKVLMDVRLDRLANSLEDCVEGDIEIVTNLSENVIFIRTKKSFQKIKWELINVQGCVVKKSVGVGECTMVKMNDLGAGVYFLNVVANDKQMGKKIVLR